MEKKKSWIAIALVICFAVMAVFLPMAIANATDRLIIDKTYEETAEESTQMVAGQLTIMEKLQMMQNQDINYDSIPNKKVTTSIRTSESISRMILDQGRKLSKETVVDTAEEEAEKLIKLGIFPAIALENLAQGFIMEPIPYFYVDTEDVTRNFILWEISIEMHNIIGSINLDDETGMILGYRIYSKDEGTILMLGAQDLAKEWGEYMQMELVEDYAGSALYRQDDELISISFAAGAHSVRIDPIF